MKAELTISCSGTSWEQKIAEKIWGQLTASLNAFQADVNQKELHVAVTLGPCTGKLEAAK